MQKRVLALAVIAMLVSAGQTISWAIQHEHSGAKQDQYAPYVFLVGEWNVSSVAGGPPIAIQRFTWGPNKSYLWYAGSFLMNGKEAPHFEGILMWNGMHKNLDMLLAADLQTGLAQEQGTVTIQPDGTVVREVTAVYSEGTTPIGQPKMGPGGGTGHFRQTFKTSGPDTLLTTVMRESDHGWVPTFPGSDHLVMTRRPKA